MKNWTRTDSAARATVTREVTDLVQTLRAAVRKYQAFGGRTREINFAHFSGYKKPLSREQMRRL